MKVRVVMRTNGNWNVHIVSVEIGDSRPICGKKRGIPYNYNFHEDGDWFSCDRWDNPCEHVDRYCDVLKEVERFQEDTFKEEIKSTKQELDRLKQENEQLRELVRLAVGDIKKPSVCECCERDCQGDDVCIYNGYMNFSWRRCCPQRNGG